MTRKALVRGIQLIVALTLAGLAYRTYVQLVEHEAGITAGFSTLRPWWLLVAAGCALQEGLFGGVRMWLIGRVATKALPLRAAITSEFVLMFCAGVSPGQLLGPPAQVAVLMNSGMRFVDIATAEILIGTCTSLLFLLLGGAVIGMRVLGLLVIPGGVASEWVVWLSIVVFASLLGVLLLSVFYPPLLKSLARGLGHALAPLVRVSLRVAERTRFLAAWAERRRSTRHGLVERFARGVDDFHAGFGVYREHGKLAYLAGFVTTVAFFGSRFAAAYFILLGLGLPTSPSTFVTVGPPIFQVIVIQAVLNFTLYVAPTPGASGIAELASAKLMSPWVSGAYELPYLLLWRIFCLFLSMFVGGLFVFRYIGAEVLEARVRQQEEAAQADRERREADADAPPGA